VLKIQSSNIAQSSINQASEDLKIFLNKKKISVSISTMVTITNIYINRLIQNITEKILIQNKMTAKNKSKYLESNKILG